ncbi:radical SAM protein [Aquihabitans sp. G128]|uniref:radical SAM protein n=1 Tax=Aquihabitans sp. G128 TaxID=2849779 RepID=UPI001C23BDE6|nr:radical SAM protein [Aquihabitans sp. G128]QXC59477.1 radical SAM protein [Aquihabitans sp. G128]
MRACRPASPLAGPAQLRWDLADEPAAQGAMFETVRREVGRGEFRGMEFLHVEAKRLLNEVRGASDLPFRWTVNPYRGCSHACSYCLAGDTPILLADGTTKPIADLRAGDQVYGTERRGMYRRYVPTEVLDHWETEKEAWRVTLADGTELVASGDHRFLTERGWKHVAAATVGQRPHLTTNNSLLGVGAFTAAPKHDEDYQRGYLCGMVRGDGTLGAYTYEGRRPSPETVYRFRLALIDDEPLDRVTSYLGDHDVAVQRFTFSAATDVRKEVRAIRAQSRAAFERVSSLVAWAAEPRESWDRGFLAGIFDAEGSSNGVVRIANTDDVVIRETVRALERFGFAVVVESQSERPAMRYVRILGGFRERLRFFHLVDPCITRKRTFDDLAVKGDADLRVVAVERLGFTIPMYDITTGTGDFVANGVISHNCFARPTHTYLGLDAGSDFDQRVVVKVNAVERLKAELHPGRWRGEAVAMGTNTDPYQRCEGKYRLTRGLIQVLIDAGNPFSILTKSTLILRDLDLLTVAARRGLVRVSLSIATVDEDVWRATEPGTPPPARRLRAVEQLRAAGIPCGVLIAPILPGLSDGDDQLAAIGRAAVEAGAISIGHVVLHLRHPEVREVYLSRLRETHPEVADATDRRYLGKAAPKADRERIASVLGDAIRAAGGELGAMEPPVPAALVELRRPVRSPKAAADPTSQLALPL